MANNWAIVIGINHYDHHSDKRLKYAVSDAQLMYGFLCNYAGFTSERTVLCLGDEKYRNTPTYPTYSNLLRLLNRDLHPNQLGKIDRFWFFFGGHGISKNGRDYLMTCDSLLEDIELKIALPIDEVIASLQRHQSADIVLILDSCREQIGSRNIGNPENRVGKQTIELAQSRGITTIFSCSYGQYSYELDTLKHGAFTHALVEGLKQYTLPGQLERYLQQKVAKLNKHNWQTPHIEVNSASKANYPLLPEHTTEEDLSEFIDLAINAELDEEFEYAKTLWLQVKQASHSSARLIQASKAIERIDSKINRLQPSSEPTEELSNSNHLDQLSPSKIETPSSQHLSSQSTSTVERSFSTETTSAFTSSIADDEDDLSSDKGIDYTKLRDLLESGRWREADEETLVAMCRATEREQEGFLRFEDFENFPCVDLRTIDQLWLKYSNGSFGFSVQKQLYLKSGGKLDRKDYGQAWNAFGNRVSWRAQRKWLWYYGLTFESSAPLGHLPAAWVCGSLSISMLDWGKEKIWRGGNSLLFSLCQRLTACRITKLPKPKPRT